MKKQQAPAPAPAPNGCAVPWCREPRAPSDPGRRCVAHVAANAAVLTMIYTSSDGRQVPVIDMPDTHLVNAIRKRERAQGGPVGGDSVYTAMRAELDRRPEQTRTWYAERVATGK